MDNITMKAQALQYTSQELRLKYQDFNIKNEIFKPVIWRSSIFPRYIISRYGNIIGPGKIILKWCKRGKLDARACVALGWKGDLIDDDYQYTNINKTITMQVHRLVAETFLPFPKYLPEAIKKDWEIVSNTTRELIRDCLQVDHRDGNGFNPRWDNLEWLTPKENQRRYMEKEWLR